MFLWIIPIPPSWAMDMANLCSVTVSIAEDKIGKFKLKVLVNCVFNSASFGKKSE